MKEPRQARLVVFAVALVARAAVIAWAGRAFPAVADGVYYEKLARRIAEGHGYTWLWPDGVVTHAAHYPVGYPALVAAAYVAFGVSPLAAMLVNALIGVAGSVAAYDILTRATRPRLAIAGGIAMALHPALLPYTAAIMTEGVTASLLMIAAACAGRAGAAQKRRAAWIVALGMTMGVATLVRPQCVALAPVFGWFAASGGTRMRAKLAAAVAALALLVCAPWTARNCARMGTCALVSVNGGWNLAIGTQTTDGGWQPIQVPEACKEVFDEAAKDACFGREARAQIARDPVAWLARVPRKLRATFDYLGAAPWYLHASNPSQFSAKAKLALGAVETLSARLLLAGALVAAMRLAGPRTRARRIVAGVGLCATVLVPGALGYVALALAVGLVGLRELARAPVIVPLTSVVIVATALTHGAFFGAGRYGLVVLPFVTAMAFVRRD